MNRIAILTAITLNVLGTSGFSASGFYVAPEGNDTHPGTQAKPFATLERARTAARSARGSTVVLAPGNYRLTQTFALDERDSGTTYQAAPGAKVLLTGGIAIPGSAVEPVTDKSILDRVLTEAARPHLRQIDLKKRGVTHYGELGARGFGRAYIPAPLELFINGQPGHIARWPNAGEPLIKMGAVIASGSIPRKGDYSMKPGTFKYLNPRVALWTQANDLYISGIFGESWADDTIPVARIDTKVGTLTTQLPHLYGFKPQSFTKWYGLNLLEEIDVPGEYFVDRQSGILYFYPPAGVELAAALIQVSLMQDVMVAIEGASNIRLKNLIFENSRGNGLYMERGVSNLIAGCTFRNLGGLAVQLGMGTQPYPEGRHDSCGTSEGGVDGVPAPRIMGNWGQYIYKFTAWNRLAGTGNGLAGCSLYNLGTGGVSMGGGDRKTLTPAGNYVRDCDIHHVNRLDRTYKACINVDGVGNLIEHNRLHDTEAQAILLHGNDHRIEYNEIAEVCRDISDMGAFYMGRDPSECGTLIRHNFFHDIRSHHTGGAGVQAIFFDDSSIYGATVFGNVFYKAGSAIVIKFNGGGAAPILNNIFVDCPTPTKGGDKSTWKVLSEMKSARGKSRLMNEVNISQQPYSTHYPELLEVYQGKRQVTTPFERNYVVTGNPALFVDAARLNFALKPGVSPGIAGFEPIPFDKIAK